MSETVYILFDRDTIHRVCGTLEAAQSAAAEELILMRRTTIEEWRVGADIDSGAWSRRDDGTWYYLDARG